MARNTLPERLTVRDLVGVPPIGADLAVKNFARWAAGYRHGSSLMPRRAKPGLRHQIEHAAAVGVPLGVVRRAFQKLEVDLPTSCDSVAIPAAVFRMRGQR